MTKRQAILFIKFQTRMAPIGENFKAGAVATICPLCNLYCDSQEESFRCISINKVIEIKGNYSNIVGQKFKDSLKPVLMFFSSEKN